LFNIYQNLNFSTPDNLNSKNEAGYYFLILIKIFPFILSPGK